MAVAVMTCISILTAAVFTVRRAGKKDVVSVFLKTLASLSFILLGFCAVRQAGTFESSWLLIPALVVCLTGDIFLDLRYVDAQNAGAWTAGGFVSFILGHACFLGYMLHGGELLRLLPAAILIGILGGIFIYITPGLMRLDYGRFRLLSAFYAAVLICTTALAVLRAVQAPGTGSVLFAAGLVLFLLSDLVLSRVYFAEGGDTPFTCSLNHGLYYAAQILIALSAAWIQG